MSKLSNVIAFTTFMMFVSSSIAAESGAEITDVAIAAESRDWDRLDQLLDINTDHRAKQPDGMTALHWAVLHNEPSAVDAILAVSEAQGLDTAEDANAATEYGVTPLVLACQSGNPRIVKRLLQVGAKVDQELPGQTTPLLLAVRTGNAAVVKRLVKAGANVDVKEAKGQTPLMWAAAAGHAEVMKVLLAGGADQAAKSKLGFTAMLFAARDGHLECCRVLVDAGVDVNAVMDPTSKPKRCPRKGSSALTLAVESGHFELAMFLLDIGADPNDQRSGFAPLHALSWVRKPAWGEGPNGDPPPRGSGDMTSMEFVRAIVAAGADVNLPLKRGKSGKAYLGGKGATPFLYASKTADLPLMSLLVELGADPTTSNADGCTPLMAAAGIGVRAVGEDPGSEDEVIAAVRFLLEHGNDVNTVDDNKETAMHGAGYRCYPRLVAFLAKNGSDPKIWNHKNESGWTPVMIAHGHRPGSFKPHPETVAAMEAVLAAAK